MPIPVEWRTATIEEIAERVGMGPFGSSIKVETFVPEGIPIISGQHLHRARLDEGPGFQHISPEHAQRLVNSNVFRGDIVLTHRGTLGQVSLIPDVSKFERYIVSQSQFYIRCDRTKVDPEFVTLYLKSPTGQHQLLANSSQVGVPSIAQPVTYLRSIEIPIPPLPEQQAIAHVLGTLDDKIELNRRMNRTLEEMARAIFQDWFVDFGPTRAKMGAQEPYLPPELWDLFPDELVDSELGQIPEGWEISRLEDVAERIAMGPFGSSIKVSTFVDSGIPIISGQHLNGTLLEDGDYRFITEDHADRLARSNVQSGDIVLTHAGNIGQAAYVPNTSQYTRYVISQRQFYMRCDTSKISPLFVVHFFKTQEGQHQLLANTSSTGVPSIARPITYLRSIALCLPSKDLLTVFDQVVGSYYRTIARNNKEIFTLATQRNSLIPKLVSGELLVRPT